MFFLLNFTPIYCIKKFKINFWKKFEKNSKKFFCPKFEKNWKIQKNRKNWKKMKKSINLKKIEKKNFQKKIWKYFKIIIFCQIFQNWYNIEMPSKTALKSWTAPSFYLLGFFILAILEKNFEKNGILLLKMVKNRKFSK